MNRSRGLLLFLPFVAMLVFLASLSSGFSDIKAQGPTQDPCRDAEGNEICPHYNSFDTRVNYLDPVASMTAYCRGDHGLDVWIISNSQGQYVYTLSEAQLSNGLGQAIATGRNIIIGDSMGMQVWGLPANLLLLHDARNGYEFSFSPALCGVTANMNYAPPQPTAAPTVEQPIVQQPVVPTAVIVIVPNGETDATEVPAAEIGVGSPVTSGLVISLRAAPHFTSKRIAQIPVGAAATIIGRNDDGSWLYVSYEGQNGWIWVRITGLSDTDIAAIPLVVAD